MIWWPFEFTWKQKEFDYKRSGRFRLFIMYKTMETTFIHSADLICLWSMNILNIPLMSCFRSAKSAWWIWQAASALTQLGPKAHVWRYTLIIASFPCGPEFYKHRCCFKETLWNNIDASVATCLHHLQQWSRSVSMCNRFNYDCFWEGDISGQVI